MAPVARRCLGGGTAYINVAVWWDMVHTGGILDVGWLSSLTRMPRPLGHRREERGIPWTFVELNSWFNTSTLAPSNEMDAKYGVSSCGLIHESIVLPEPMPF